MADSGLPQEMIDSAAYRRGRMELFDSLDPAHTALIVIDMQKAWLSPGAPFETPAARPLVAPINRLAGALRAHGGLVVWIQHTTAPPGQPGYWALYFDNFIKAEDRAAATLALVAGAPMHALADGLDVQDGDLVLPKHRFSAFVRNPHDLEAMLRARGIDTLIVTGVATNVCVESTVREAMMLDFRVFMPHDAVAAPKPEAHLAGLRNVMQSFADVRPTDQVAALIEE
ncbi:MAG: isochorismatase family cysteine hydrolase [Caulobacteraceae bacterium]